MLKNSSTILIYYNLPVYTFNISYNINLCYKSHLLLIQQPNRKRQNLPLWECQTWLLVDSSRVWPQLDLKNFGSTRLDRSELDEGLNSTSLNRSEIWKARLGSTRLASCRGVTPKVAVEQNFQCVLSGTVSGAGISQPTGSSTHNVTPKMRFDSLNKFINVGGRGVWWFRSRPPEKVGRGGRALGEIINKTESCTDKSNGR
jgi:hypothetical protein